MKVRDKAAARRVHSTGRADAADAGPVQYWRDVCKSLIAAVPKR